jgi:alpha-glucosidase
MVVDIFPSSILNVEQKGRIVECSTGDDFVMQIHVLSDNIIRFRCTTEGIFEDDFSYGISKRFEPLPSTCKVTDKEKILQIDTADLSIRIDKATGKKSIRNKEGLLIIEDEKGCHWEENETFGGNIVKMSHHLQDAEHFYGLGDKTCSPNLRGKRLQNWGTDIYGFEKDSDPLYKNIPFFIGLHHGVSYGIFFDNTFRSHFDFGSERRSVASFWAHGGEMNYYFIYGPEMSTVSERYIELTGKADLPPLWALGYHQCKWSYYPEAQVREVCHKFRELEIPCDAIYLDIDYMDGFRCFTWDKEKFPNPEKMISDLKSQGFKTVVIIDPGIKVDKDYDVFNEGMEGNFFCRRADGPIYKGKVWPGDCYFPDFTNPKVRKWWTDLFEDLIVNKGVMGVWNDMNEPAVFEVESKTFPLDVRHDYDGHPCSHRKAHNIYGMQMARATAKGVKKYMKPNRPFVITRSAYSGAQRYSSVWTGDNKASWEHLWVANVQCQRLSISGFSFAGTDIGGFIDHPTPELYIRYMQMAVFHTFFRTHSSGDHGNQEPWSFGDEATAIVKSYIELRYRLLPYIYTNFYQYVKNGTPMLRPLYMYDQKDEETLYRSDEFLFGDHIFVCPIMESNAIGRYFYLPEGDWYSYWDDKAYKGKKETWFDCDLKTIPVLIKAGAVIPHYPVVQYIKDNPPESMTLHVYYKKGKEVSLLYEDAGDGYEYNSGVYNEKVFTVEGTKDLLRLSQNRMGHYVPNYDEYQVVLHGLPAEPKEVLVNGNHKGEVNLEKDGNVYKMKVSRKFLEIEVKML